MNENNNWKPRPTKYKYMSENICEACEETTGGIAMGCVFDDKRSATLQCPNCGSHSSMLSDDVLRPHVDRG